MGADDTELQQLLGPDGALSQQVAGFAPRPQQQQMATAVEQALDDNQVLVVEAGTGTGKTYAYLVPALLSGKKVVISTGTRNLQDQLFHKDLPVVRGALRLAAKTALLKGRSNYLCRYRLQLTEAERGRLARPLQADLGRVSLWSGRTRSGDVAEVIDVAEDSPLWPRVTSTTDNCLGAECPEFADCYLVKARRRALEADLVVINHHLLCADMVIKEEGFGEVLPSADAFILDEAHQLPEVASLFFGQSLGSRQLLDLARDVRVEQLRDAADFPQLADRAVALERGVGALLMALTTRSGRGAGREPWASQSSRPAIATAASDLSHALALLDEALAEAAVRGKGLESCWARCQALSTLLQRFYDDEGNDSSDKTPSADAGLQQVRWVEIRSRSFSLHLTPLAVGEYFRARMQQHQSSWIFTSATLAVSDGFQHFSDRLGLDEPTTLKLDSPFDYARNALLYHPKAMPEPSAPDYNQAVLEAALPVLSASRGRAFILFTSHQALREAADWLTEYSDHQLLVQGTLPKDRLLERFRVQPGAVLLGTNSFWEGVDVRGEALSCVVIAKLPFASPGEPVLQARIDALRRAGGNPFMDHQVPQAVIALKQGVGRLIRDVSDRGVLMLCDPRLLSKPYGKIFLRSLPPMQRTRSLLQVQQFFDTDHQPQDVA